MRLLALITVLAAGLAWFMGGTAPFGRVLLAAGLPRTAAVFLDDPAWNGVAQYRAGDRAAARDAFEAAGAHYDRGNAEVRIGDYAAALEAYDIAAASGDADARVNFDIVSAFYAGTAVDPDALIRFAKRETGPKVDSFIARGEARAAGTGDTVTNTNTMLGIAGLDSRGRLGVRRIFSDRHMVADARWLRQIADVPGAYLKARIAAEAKARKREGLTPLPEDPN